MGVPGNKKASTARKSGSTFVQSGKNGAASKVTSGKGRHRGGPTASPSTRANFVQAGRNSR